MRTLTAQDSAALSAAIGYSVFAKVEIRDAGGVWRDLGELVGRNWLRNISYDETVDDPGLAATVVLNKRVWNHSLSPLHETSEANNLSGTYSPLVQINRDIRIHTATVPMGVAAQTSDYRLVFQGRIGSISFPGDTVEVQAVDMSKVLVNSFIQREKAYSTTSGVAVETVMQTIIDDHVGGSTWQASTAYAVGDMVRPTTRNGYGYRVTTAGTSGPAEPTWPTNEGGTVTNGSVTFKRFQATPTLYTPTSPAWVIGEFKQAKATTFDSIDALAKQIGWQVRYRYRTSTSQFELTFLEPDRTASSTVFTIGPDKYESVEEIETNDADIRNQVRVFYYDPSVTDSTGKPSLQSVYVEDGTSLDKYGSRYMDVSFSGASNINTQAEALKLAQAALSDLKEPVANLALKCQYLYHLELGDYILVQANGDHFTSDWSASVTGIRHTISAPGGDGAMECSTVLNLRLSKPVSHSQGWRDIEATRGSTFTQHVGPTITAIGAQPGGYSLQLDQKQPQVALKPPPFPIRTGIHVSTTSGFTPSASNLAMVTTDPRPNLTGLTPGVTHYVKAVSRDERGNISATSSEVSVLPGYVEELHLAPVLRPQAPLHVEIIADSTVEPASSSWTDLLTGDLSMTTGRKVAVTVSGQARLDTAGSAGLMMLRVEARKMGDTIVFDSSADYPISVVSETDATPFSVTCILDPGSTPVDVTFALLWSVGTGGKYAITADDFVSMVVAPL